MTGSRRQIGVQFRAWALPASAGLIFIPLLIALFDGGRWPLVHDAPLLHYIVFLMDKGFVPYRDIIDMNMPGAYVLESLGMHAFGGGAHGWFIWDLICDAIAVLASTWIAGPTHRAAGMVAGSLACLLHLADGALNLGQRDWTVAVLLLLSFGFLFKILRGGRSIWSCGVFFFATAATLVKPPALLFCLLALGALGWLFRKSPHRIVPNLLCGLAGFAPPIVVVILFLIKWHAGKSFLHTMTTLVPYYASLQRTSIAVLLWSDLGVIQKVAVPFAIVALVLFLLSRSWRSMESTLLLLGAFCGTIYYIAQDKGWSYQRYPAIAFALLWIALEVEKGLRVGGVRSWIAWPTLLGLVFVLPSIAVIRERLKPYSTATMLHLQSDLEGFGGQQLSRRVQCLDMTHADCINVLYRLGLVQSTGFIYDFYLFPEQPTSVTIALQSRFLRMVSADPPKAFILSEQVWPGGGKGYKQLARWPAFNDYLLLHYRLAAEYSENSSDTEGYRIYLLN